MDRETNSYVVDERVTIALNGGSQSFTVPPGKYIVTIQDDDGDFYRQHNYYFNIASLQFTVTAGATKTVIYNFEDSSSNLILR
jgi:hypothetical protein